MTAFIVTILLELRSRVPKPQLKMDLVIKKGRCCGMATEIHIRGKQRQHKNALADAWSQWPTQLSFRCGLRGTILVRRDDPGGKSAGQQKWKEHRIPGQRDGIAAAKNG
jgi:hypothetical protein